MTCPNCSNEPYRGNDIAAASPVHSEKKWNERIRLFIYGPWFKTGKVAKTIVGFIGIILIVGLVIGIGWLLIPGIYRLGYFVAEKLNWKLEYPNTNDPNGYCSHWFTGLGTALIVPTFGFIIYLSNKLGNLIFSKDY